MTTKVFAALFFLGGLALLVSGGLRFQAHHDGHHTIVSATVTSSDPSCSTRGCHRTAVVDYTVDGTAQKDVRVVDADWSQGDTVEVLVDTDSPRKAIEVGDRGYLRIVVGLVLWGFTAALLLEKAKPAATP